MAEQWRHINSGKANLQKWTRDKAAELESLSAKALPFSSADKSHYEHQLQLLTDDIQAKVNELQGYVDEQQVLAGERVTDQQVDEMNGKLNQLLDKISGMRRRYNSHCELCEQVQQQLVSVLCPEFQNI